MAHQQKENENRSKNIGSEALELLIHYSFFNLNLHQLYANISVSNAASIALFTKFGFEKIGIKKDWILLNNHYHDEAIFQLINKEHLNL